MRRMHFLLILVSSFAIAAAQIVDKTEFSPGEQFTVTCDIAKFTGNLPTTFVTQLNLQRKTSTDSTFTDLAIFYPAYDPPDSYIRNIPWDIQFIGGTPSNNNRNTIKIVMVANSTACKDAGLYRCLAMFFKDSNQYTTTAVNLTASAPISQNDIVTVPYNEREEAYTSYIQVGENITMTCTCTGPLNLQIVWKYTRAGFSLEEDYPIKNEISTANPVPASSTPGCNSYTFSSTLSIQLQQMDDGNIYYCTVQYNNIERSRRNFTIKAAAETPSDGPSTGTAETNVGAIVGGVIGGVVLLVLIVVLVYFFVIRKRKSEGDEDKRKNVESTDHKDNFTPPPVFYTKPHKPPKDESDGSRPVGMTNDALDISYDSKDLKGPPQYTNTVDDYEPPGYEKETHRGRANKGYEEEKEEKKEGHRSRRHRDRSEDKEKEPEDKDRREDRRSRHRDRGEAEPRGRHYSTEDGTDDRYVGYGDPNMGTSI